MAIPRSTKLRIILGIVVVLLLAGGWSALSISWRRGHAHGIVTGTVRKISVHGPPYCKFLTGELVYQGGNAGQQQEVFNFSVDDHQESNPVVRDLEAAERSGARVTLDYRQDLRLWWRCNPSQLFITAVVK